MNGIIVSIMRWRECMDMLVAVSAPRVSSLGLFFATPMSRGVRHEIRIVEAFV